MTPENIKRHDEFDAARDADTVPEALGWVQFMAQDPVFIQRLGKPALEALLESSGCPTRVVRS